MLCAVHTQHVRMCKSLLATSSGCSNLHIRILTVLIAAVHAPSRPVHIAAWKIGVAAAGSLSAILLLATLAVLLWTRTKRNQRFQVNPTSYAQQRPTFTVACSVSDLTLHDIVVLVDALLQKASLHSILTRSVYQCILFKAPKRCRVVFSCFPSPGR